MMWPLAPLSSANHCTERKEATSARKQSQEVLSEKSRKKAPKKFFALHQHCCSTAFAATGDDAEPTNRLDFARGILKELWAVSSRCYVYLQSCTGEVPPALL